MKYLTLIRHAKASWAGAHKDDFDRPLEHRGEVDAPRMGRHLEQEFFRSGRIPRPDRIVSSPALRAISTARLIAREIGYPDARILEDRRIYDAGAPKLLKVIGEAGDALDHLMLFGHNPGLETLACELAPSLEQSKFPTCAVAILELEDGSWSSLAEGCAVRGIFLCPKMV